VILSKERLQQVAYQTGYRAEIIEKVVLLIHFLDAIAKDNYLKNRLVLKGGTALNLFYFDLPRLSVDADLNYIGALAREEMLVERTIVEARLHAILQQMGLQSYRQPTVHAGGKMIWRYPSSMGQYGNLEVDLNFMYRVTLWPTEYKNSVQLGNQQAKNVPVLNIHELAAGKLSALIDRGAGRDIFDAHYLLKLYPLDSQRLRQAFVIYSGMNTRRDIRKLTPKDINFNLKELKDRLLPVLRVKEIINNMTIKQWAENLLLEIQQCFEQLLPFTHQEVIFLSQIRETGVIAPELFCNDLALNERVKQHPALKWAVLQFRGDKKPRF